MYIFPQSLQLANIRWCFSPSTTLDHKGNAIPLGENDTYWCRYVFQATVYLAGFRKFKVTVVACIFEIFLRRMLNRGLFPVLPSTSVPSPRSRAIMEKIIRLSNPDNFCAAIVSLAGAVSALKENIPLIFFQPLGSCCTCTSSENGPLPCLIIKIGRNRSNF